MVLAPGRDRQLFGGRLAGAHASTAWHGMLSEMGMIVVSQFAVGRPDFESLVRQGRADRRRWKALEGAFVGFADDLSWWVEAAKAQRAKKAPPY